jgi:hypothetical protein
MKTLLLASIILLPLPVAAAQHPSMPACMSHEEHLRQLAKDDALKHRGTLAMGFDQDQATHHFLLRANGGAIEVSANNTADAKTISEIQSHFREIADAFAHGAFDKPLATHDEMPPGTDIMAKNKNRIRYRYEERSSGAAVVIETSDAATLAAIHDFLRYQITEHRTGDPLTVPR